MVEDGGHLKQQKIRMCRERSLQFAATFIFIIKKTAEIADITSCVKRVTINQMEFIYRLSKEERKWLLM